MGRNSVLITNVLLMCNWCRVITVSLFCCMVLLYRLNWSLSPISGLYCNTLFNMSVFSGVSCHDLHKVQ